MTKTLPPIAAAGACLLLPSAAWAHGGHGADFAAGVLHPFTGLDHALAAVAAGWWAASANRRTGLLGAGAFVLALAGGIAATQAWGIGVFGQEALLALTVVALGALLFVGLKPHAAVAAPVLAAFAFVHGLAHGSEHADAGALVGIVLGTSMLTALGAVAGWLARTPQRLPLQRLAGFALAVSGVALLLR